MDSSSKFINIMFLVLSLIAFMTYGFDLIKAWVLLGYQIPWRESVFFAFASLAFFIFTKQYLEDRKSPTDKKNVDI